MLRIAMANSFVDALAGLDPADTKRTAAFLEKLLREPDSSALHMEPVREASDRSIRSLRVTDGLRAIAHTDADRLLLLYVGQHDHAYRWARNHCVECHPVTGELQVVATTADATDRLVAATAISEAERIARGAPPHGAPGPFENASDEYLLSLGVPQSWLPTVRMVTDEDTFLAIATDLPQDVAGRLLRVVTGELVPSATANPDCRQDAEALPSGIISTGADALTLPGPGSWMCYIDDGQQLCRLLDKAGVDHGLAN
jgi:hypothetical protein